jgi:L-threonylcarbamoyladenylate synthase
MKKTLVFKVDPQEPDIEKITKAAQVIKEGGLVAFPTETVYGLGADALNAQAILAVFEAKQRPLDNPPIIHVSDVEDVRKLAQGIPPVAEKLMRKFWPGPLTLIFKRSANVPDLTVSGLDTIAIRMPKHNVALCLIRESNCPIAAPSANLAGKPSPTSASHVLNDLDGRIDMVLDAGTTNIGLESTVLDLTVDPPQVLRPGGTPFEDLLEALRSVELNPVATTDRPLPIERARSPGIKHKHYAPNADMVVVEGELEAIVRKVNELVRAYEAEGNKVGVLATNETLSNYRADVVKSLGGRNDSVGLAKRLFKLLREFDSEDVDLIIAESVPSKGLGLAVMNRLRKASGYKIVKAN